MRGHDDHRQLRSPRAHFIEQVEAGLAGHAHVGDEHVGLAAAQCRERAVGVLERGGRHARLLERALEHPADGGVVVDDPDLKSLWLIHWRRRGEGS